MSSKSMDKHGFYMIDRSRIDWWVVVLVDVRRWIRPLSCPGLIYVPFAPTKATISVKLVDFAERSASSDH